jgi:hypothetical protein
MVNAHSKQSALGASSPAVKGASGVRHSIGSLDLSEFIVVSSFG